MVRKGLFTPFHQLKGYERCIRGPGESRKSEAPGQESSGVDRASIDKVIQSFSKAVQNRPTTKLLDVEDAPKLEPPTFSFQRLKAPIKIPRSPEDDEGDSRKRKKRPLPDKKWRKVISREEMDLENDGMLIAVLYLMHCLSVFA